MPIDGEEKRPWQPMLGFCEHCQPIGAFTDRLAGSVWDTVFNGLHRDYPKEVLQYELLLLINHFEREAQSNDE